MKRKAGKKQQTDYEISCIETFRLGGYEQKVLIEGKYQRNPLFITLHGGPGTPIPFCVGSSGLFPEITNDYILVCWDQYGCGINNAVVDDTFTIEDFTNMTVDLIKLLKKKFPDNKLYLFGMSWGSILSAKAAETVPELIDGVLAYGQVLKAPMRSEDAYHSILSSNVPAKVKKTAKILVSQEPVSHKLLMQISGAIRKYTEGYTNKLEPKSPMGKMISGILKNPDYRFKDFIAMMKNGYGKNNSLTEALAAIDLSPTLKNLKVPYDIIQGSTDIVTSTKMLVEFVSSCHNSNIRCEVVENAAHIPGMNGMDAVITRLQNMG
ncbi:MAG: alpha/beta hydrolase [Blautia sp.]|nr:alpha/beta hydrolase [Lachnoclostridium sp.]MCM1212849.1 alpha/beta hydrolase [Blautia sp.]